MCMMLMMHNNAADFTQPHACSTVTRNGGATSYAAAGTDVYTEAKVLFGAME